MESLKSLPLTAALEFKPPAVLDAVLESSAEHVVGAIGVSSTAPYLADHFPRQPDEDKG